METQLEYNESEVEKCTFNCQTSLRAIKKSYFSGSFIAQLHDEIDDLNTLFNPLGAANLLDVNYKKLKCLIKLLRSIHQLSLQGDYRIRLEEMLEKCLLRVMELSSPFDGLKMELLLLGECLEVINNYQDPNRIRILLLTKQKPHIFPLFYFMQHAVRDCIYNFNPRHYFNIRVVLDAPIYLRSLQRKCILPSTDVVKKQLMDGCISFNIQALLMHCLNRDKCFQQSTALFLIGECGADIEKSGLGGKFLELAIALIIDNDPSSLAALTFYLDRTKREPQEVLASIKEAAKKAYSSNIFTYWVAAKFLQNRINVAEMNNDNNATYGNICLAAMLKFRKQMTASIRGENSESKNTVAILLERYLAEHDPSEIQHWLQVRVLEEPDEQLLIQEATRLDPKFGKDIAEYIAHIRSNVARRDF